MNFNMDIFIWAMITDEGSNPTWIYNVDTITVNAF